MENREDAAGQADQEQDQDPALEQQRQEREKVERYTQERPADHLPLVAFYARGLIGSINLFTRFLSDGGQVAKGWRSEIERSMELLLDKLNPRAKDTRPMSER